MRRLAVPAALAALALGLTACAGGGDPTSPATDETSSSSASRSPSETPSATSSATETSTASAPSTEEAPVATEAPAETSVPAPEADPGGKPAALSAAPGLANSDYSHLLSTGNEDGYIEIDAWADNGEPGAWTEYDAQGNAIGAAIGGPPAGQGGGGGEFDYAAAVQDPESPYYGMTVDEARATDDAIVDAFGGEDAMYEWLAWMECGNDVLATHADTYPGTDATEEEVDAYYATDVDALQAEQCGPEPA